MNCTRTANRFSGGLYRAATVLALALLASGCGGGGGGGGGANQALAALLSVGGTWVADISIESDDCDTLAAGIDFDPEVVIIRQEDAAVVLHQEDGTEIARGTLGLDRVLRLTDSDGNEIELTVTPSLDDLDFTFSGTNTEDDTRSDGTPCRTVMRINGVRVALDDAFPLTSVDGEIGLGVSSGNTILATNDFESSCTDPSGSGPDVAFLFTAPETGAYRISTEGSSSFFDTVLSVLEADGFAELACHDAPLLLPSEIEISLVAGQEVVVVLDGFSTFDAGPYQLEITKLAATPVHRVNCGGGEVADADLVWSEDTNDNPSPFRGDAGVEYPLAIFELEDSVPAGTPNLVFETLIFDMPGDSDLQYDFPVAPGTYEVRLYFGESYFCADCVGARIFNTQVEGDLFLEDFDILAETDRNVGIARTTTVHVDDGNLDIDFEHVTNSPVIVAIEIIRL